MGGMQGSNPEAARGGSALRSPGAFRTPGVHNSKRRRELRFRVSIKTTVQGAWQFKYIHVAFKAHKDPKPRTIGAHLCGRRLPWRGRSGNSTQPRRTANVSKACPVTQGMQIVFRAACALELRRKKISRPFAEYHRIGGIKLGYTRPQLCLEAAVLSNN